MTEAASAPNAPDAQDPKSVTQGKNPLKRKGVDWGIVKLALACLGLQLATFTTVAVSPFIMGSILEARQFTPGVPLLDSQAGQIRTAEILVYAVLCIVFGARIRFFEPRTLGLVGLMIMIGANAVAMFGTGAWDLYLWRMLHAAGGACAMTAAAALLVRALNPQRVSGAITIPTLAMGMGGVIFASRLDNAGELSNNPMLSQIGAYGAIMTAAIIGLVLTYFFAPRGKSNADIQPAFSSMFGALRSPYTISAAMIYFGSTAVWQSFRQIGLTHDLNPAEIGNLIVAAQVFGALCGAGMTFLKADWVRPGILISMIVFAAATIALPLAPNALVFIVGQFCLTGAYIGTVVLLGVVGARLDRTGGLNAAGTGWQSLVNATSPFFGGIIIDQMGGYHNLYVMCLFAAAIAIPAMVIATRNLPAPHLPGKT